MLFTRASLIPNNTFMISSLFTRLSIKHLAEELGSDTENYRQKQVQKHEYQIPNCVHNQGPRITYDYQIM